MPDLGAWAKPTLVGERVTLRPYVEADADAVWEMVHDAEGADLTGTTAEFTRTQIDEWTASRADAPDRLDLAIVENATGEYAGEVVLNDYDARVASANYRVSLRGPAWYGRGLGTEAGRLIIDHAFADIGLSRITLDLLARNPRALRSYERLGFVETRRYDEGGDIWVDMELTREQWESGR